jgi:type 1 glutamine amidotransferase
MRIFICSSLLAAITVLCLPSVAQQPQQPRRKKLLVIGEVKGYQHDSVAHAMASLEKWGKETDLWDTYIRTDTQLITKQKLQGNAKNLDFFDAVAFYTTGELPLDEQQKADLLVFVRDEGKGFIGMHSAGDTLYKWPEYGELVGGWFDAHPWNTFPAPIVVEDRSATMTRHLPKEMVIHDEIYQYKNWSRDKVRVLMRLDEGKIDLANKNVRRADKDFAVTWIKPFGKGRVFATTLGHREEVYDMPEIRKMFIEGVKWAMRLTDEHTESHTKPSASDNR